MMRHPGAGQTMHARHRGQVDTTMRRLPAVWLLLAALAAPLAAAGDCEQLLGEADAAYRTGRFEDALSSLQACLQTRPPAAARVPVLALEAKVRLAMDEREAAGATLTELLRLDPRYAPDPLRDPPLFLSMLGELRHEDTAVKIRSVSKTEESLREAPATVLVVTAEQIARRGYLDLEAVLHDLPGFDISRTNGPTYANVYQRGHRSVETNRTLVLIDGVEENDLWSSTVYLSRQYPLTHVDRVEVIYGPASTMYGANALAGVVNVITKQPGAVATGGERVSVFAEATAGSFGTTIFDATLAGRSQSLSWIVTGRLYRSDEPDLSAFDDWDYDPAYIADVPYADLLRLKKAEEVDDFLKFLAENPDLDCRGEPGCDFALTPDSVELTAAGAARAEALDTAAYFDDTGRPIAYSDPSDDWLVHAKVNVANLEAGVQLWRRDEGATAWYTDRTAPGAAQEQFWIPQQTSMYLKYERSLRPDLSLTLFARYKRHELENPSVLRFFSGYLNEGLDLENLLRESPAEFAPGYYHLANNQLRGEVSVVYEPSGRFNVVGGVELRDSSLQGNYVFSEEANPAETGEPLGTVGGGNDFNQRDLGLFAQASFRLWGERLKLVAGGRLDHNEVRDTLGYGTVFNPRQAAIYRHRDWVFKAIYAESFQDAPNFQKYGTTGSRKLPSPDLEPEDVSNVELSAGWQPSEDLGFEISAYDARYSGVPEQVSVPCPDDLCDEPGARTGRFQNSGALEIRGLQATAFLRRGMFEFFANYTYTDPTETAPLDESGLPAVDEQGHPITSRRVGDISSHQLNLAANAELRERWNFNLRLNWVGTKETVFSNPLREVDSYLVAHAAVTYKDLFPGVSLQLVVNNLFDELYYHPGLRDADGTFHASQIPQSERSAFLRVRFSY